MNFMLKQCLSSRKQKQRALGDVHPSPIQCFPGYFLRSIFSTSLCFGFLIRDTRGLDKATQQHSRSLTSPFVSPTTRVVSFSYVLLFNLRTHVSVIQRAVNSLKARALLYTLFLKPYQILFLNFFSNSTALLAQWKIKNIFQMNECTLASRDSRFSQLNTICFNNPRCEFWKMAKCWIWAEMMEASFAIRFTAP